MKNLYLFQPQYPSRFKDQIHYWIPYSAGAIWAYATQFEDIVQEFALGQIFFQRSRFDTVLSQLHEPAVCGFSCYAWNEQYNLQLAQLIKQRWPACVIMFGGAQANPEYLKYDFIDTVMLAEGEQSFVNALRDIVAGRELPELYPKARVQDLDTLPSPYTMGLFDAMIASEPTAYWNAVLETNRGCPFQCTFCDWGGTTYSKVKKFNLERVQHDIEWMAQHRVSSIFIADANFGIFAQRDSMIADMIKSHSANSYIDYVNITYTKNSNENVFKIAKQLYPLTKAVTISMQSMNPATLEAIKRTNLGTNDLKHVMQLSQQYAVPTYTEMILGMPQETLESWKTGMTDLLEAGQHNQIDVFFTMLLKNSEMSQPADRFRYGIRGIDVTDYMLFSKQEDETEEPIKEIAELICATNTMSRDQMITSYMYSWMIINMHIMGYSQILAQYSRYVRNISYREFYDRMFDMIVQHPVLGTDFAQMQQAVHELLTRGTITTLPIMVNHMAFYSYVPLYQKRQHCFDLAEQVANSFGTAESSVQELQRLFVYDHGRTYPVSIDLNYNITDWSMAPTQYQIQQRVPQDFVPDYFNISLQRRRGFLKNQIGQSK